MENELEHLSTELTLIEEQLETKTLPYSDRQLLIQAWNEINMRIEELLEPPKPLQIAPAPPSYCEGCKEDQPNQLAHTGPGGCLEDKYPATLEELAAYNDIVDDRSCEKCAGCSNCANAEASYDGADEI